MRHTGSRMYARPAPVPQMPPGLVQLMEGLTRDVLQHNPANVYEFCARHMEQLLIIRDGAAPTKKRLTLEQKIKRAQEKVREKAEQRRRKFDEDIKKYQPDVLEAESLSAKEEKETESGAKQETEQSIAISNEAQHDVKEIVKSTESALETKLKAPVHHEQDLAEALEVEIFHKPVDEGLNLKAPEARDLNNIPEREINELDTKLIESIKNDEVLKESNSMDSKDNENLANSDGTDHVNDSLEQVIISETILNDSHDHVRTRRSVDIEENYKSKSETLDENDVTKIVEEQNNTTENADELKSVQEENTVAETVDHSEISNNEDVNSVEVSNGNQIDTELKDNITKTAHLELDSATAFAFEMCEVKSTPETVHNDPVQAANENVSEDKTKLPAELENKIVSTSIISPNASITIEDITSQEESMKKNVNDEAKVIDNNILKNDNSEQALSSEVEIANNNKNENDLGLTENNVSRNEVATNEISLDNDDSEKNYTINEKLESTAHLNETELKKDDTTIVKETTEDKKMLDQNSEITDSQKDETEKVHIDLEKEKILNTDDKIIEAIEQLEVCTEPIESSLNDTIESLEVHGNMESENNIKVNEANKEVLTEDGAVENRSISEGNSHGTITSVDKVLVEESSGINDDNDSAPEQQIIENDIHMNGTHEIMSGIMENGNDSPEPHIISAEDVPPNEDIPKVVDITPEVHDDVTNTSDPIKTDPEVSSLGKSSSMDSFIEEVVDTITEVDEMKPTTAKTAQNKEASSSMDLETAAITIQKVFRTFLFKSRESTFDESGRGNSIDGDNETTEVEFPVTSAPLNKERRTLGISRMDTVLQTVNEEKSLSLSTDDSSLSSAATIIQAHVRGFLTRNRLNSNKTNSSSLVNSDAPSSTSLENDLDQKANKTVLNIHIVPEGEHFLSRDESLLTSMELSLDGSPPSSTNLHPLGYDKSEPRKQLKREDAIQSVSPPSNNSGKLSEDIDSVKDMPIIDSEQQKVIENTKDEKRQDLDIDRDDTPTKSTTIETVIEAYKLTNESSSSPEPEKEDVKTTVQRKRSLANISSDECDVVTPFEEKSATDSDASSRLLHSGEFHDIVLPTKVSRGDTSVVREFKNVLVYFLIWNNS